MATDISVNSFKEARLKARRTALDVAQELNVSVSYLYKIERSEIRPSRRVAASLADVLNMPRDATPDAGPGPVRRDASAPDVLSSPGASPV